MPGTLCREESEGKRRQEFLLDLRALSGHNARLMGKLPLFCYKIPSIINSNGLKKTQF